MSSGRDLGVTFDFCWPRRTTRTQVKAEVKTNKDGVRGLFATEFVKENDNIISVPAAAIINAGGLSDSFAVGLRRWCERLGRCGRRRAQPVRTQSSSSEGMRRRAPGASG